MLYRRRLHFSYVGFDPILSAAGRGVLRRYGILHPDETLLMDWQAISLTARLSARHFDGAGAARNSAGALAGDDALARTYFH
jgi:hypothetical protein